MEEILAALIGAIATALLGWLVLNYKSQITYHLVSLSSDFVIVNGEIVAPAQGSRKHSFVSERITIQNRGLRAISNVRLHLERTPSLFSSEVQSTASLSSQAVIVDQRDGYLEIVVDHLPTSEKIVLELAYVGYGANEFRSLKGTGGSYKVVEEEEFQSVRKALFGSLGFMLIIPAVIAGGASIAQLVLEK